MNVIEVNRNSKLSTTEATYSTLVFNGIQIGFCLELGWNKNIKGKSCIPDGEYQLLPHNSPKHPNTVAFHNPDLLVFAEPASSQPANARTDCLIHPANFTSELEGCLAPGTDYMYNTNHKPIGVKESQIAYAKLVKAWGDRSNLTAIIRWV